MDSAVAPPVAGAVSAAEAAEAAAAASMRALPTPSPVRSHPHALFPSVRDGSIRTRDPHAEAEARYPRHQLLGFHTQIAAGAPRTLVENKFAPPPLTSPPHDHPKSTEVGEFIHACEGEAVCKLTNPKVPYFNGPIFLENKTQVGKVEEIFGPINASMFTIKMAAVSYTHLRAHET